MSRILIVEDEAHLAEGLRFNLEADGHDAFVAADGETALRRLLVDGETVDVVVLDVMLPGRDGFAVATELRARGQFVPILMLTARGRPEDVLRGFEAGADDYLPKPFELAILLARVHGLLRRRQWNEQAPSPDIQERRAIHVGGLTLDFGAMEIRHGSQVHRLTQMECDLLRYLVEHAGQAVSRRAILEQVWGLHEDTDTRAIDNFIVRLRRYIEENPAAPRRLLTVRGVGYRFVADAPPPAAP